MGPIDRDLYAYVLSNIIKKTRYNYSSIRLIGERRSRGNFDWILIQLTVLLRVIQVFLSLVSFFCSGEHTEGGHDEREFHIIDKRLSPHLFLSGSLKLLEFLCTVCFWCRILGNSARSGNLWFCFVRVYLEHQLRSQDVMDTQNTTVPFISATFFHPFFFCIMSMYQRTRFSIFPIDLHPGIHPLYHGFLFPDSASI